MSVNSALLRRTLEHIESHPETWDQSQWAIRHYRDGATCGTVFCFAGHAAQLAGHQIRFVAFDSSHDYAPATKGLDACQQDAVSTNELIRLVAQRELGLDDRAADWLFCESNSLDELREIVDQLVSEAA